MTPGGCASGGGEAGSGEEAEPGADDHALAYNVLIRMAEEARDAPEPPTVALVAALAHAITLHLRVKGRTPP